MPVIETGTSPAARSQTSRAKATASRLRSAISAGEYPRAAPHFSLARQVGGSKVKPVPCSAAIARKPS